MQARLFVWFAVTLGVASPALAVNWVRYNSDARGTVYYYDSDSVRRTGNLVRVWELQDHIQDASVAHRQTKNLIEIDCDADTDDLVSTIQYRADGRVLQSVHLRPHEREARPIVPGSVAEALRQRACPTGVE